MKHRASRPRGLEMQPCYPDWHPWPDHPSCSGAASLLPPEPPKVLLWLPDPAVRGAWKSGQWVAREKAEARRPLGFRVGGDGNGLE